MGMEAVVRAVKKQALLSGAAGLLAKRAAPIKKKAQKAVLLKLVKSSSAGGMKKQALIGGIGKWLTMTGGKGLKFMGKQLGKVHAGAGSAVSRAGSRLKRHAGLAELGMAMEGMKGGKPTWQHLQGTQMMGSSMPLTRADRLSYMTNLTDKINGPLIERLAKIAPEAREALGKTRALGAATGVGGLTALLLSGGGGEKAQPQQLQITPEQLRALLQAQGQGVA